MRISQPYNPKALTIELISQTKLTNITKYHIKLITLFSIYLVNLKYQLKSSRSKYQLSRRIINARAVIVIVSREVASPPTLRKHHNTSSHFYTM